METTKNELVFLDTETTGISAVDNRIICISAMKLGETEPMLFSTDTDPSEANMLRKFWEWLPPGCRICGFNTDFDWDFLLLRSLKHKVPLRWLRKYKDRIDLMHLLNGRAAPMKGRSQDAYCELMGIHVPLNGDIRGKDIPNLYNLGEIGKINEHCQADVLRLVEMYNRFKECGIDLERWE